MSPSLYWKKVNHPNYNQGTKYDKYQIDVQMEYVPAIQIYYSHTSYYRENLMDYFYAAESYCKLEGIQHSSGKMYGVYTHISFHGPKDQLNYYAGVEIMDNTSPKDVDKIFFVPEGRYASFLTNAPLTDLFGLVNQWKSEWLDNKPYSIRDIFAFEEIFPSNKNSDYPCLSRKIYIPIKHK